VTLNLFDVGPVRRTHGGGRPAHEPTDQTRLLVAVLVANGEPLDIIAQQLGIARQTLYRHYRPELKYGFGLIKARMQGGVVQKGLEGDLRAMLEWLRRFCPEWRVTKEDIAAQADADAATRAATDAEDNEVVHFYLPPNGRDEPLDQEAEGPVIDGDVAAA
jgi:DNA-binding transcriptional ArsR family regulator